MTPSDPRARAFFSALAPEIFHSVEHRHEIWRHDRYDVESVYEHARDAFGRLLTRATTPPGLASGRILLLLGESGSGKTHLLRVFRNQAHGDGNGLVGYMQMTTRADDFGRYMLSNFIDSLDHPYDEVNRPSELTGLTRLSNGVARRALGAQAIARLNDEATSREDLDQLVRDAADEVLMKPGLASADVELVRALLYLQREDPRIKSRVLRWLRCEDLAAHDRAYVGDLVPRTKGDDGGRMLEALGALAWRLGQLSLVLEIDQLEDGWNMEDAIPRFRRAMSAVCDLADRVPSSIVVVSCLEEFYEQMKPHLSGSARDRLELDPEPVRLQSERSLAEVRQLVGKRLAHLYELAEVEGHDGGTFPIPDGVVEGWARLRTRDVLDQCRRYREQGPQAASAPVVAPAPSPSFLHLQQAWNDFLSAFEGARPDDEDDLASLLAWAIRAVPDELESGATFDVKLEPGALDVVTRRGAETKAHLGVFVVNKDARGGHLGKQIEAARQHVGRRTAVLVRTSAFPSSPGTQIVKAIGTFIAAGARKTVVEEAEWRTVMALRAFRLGHAADPLLATWLAHENPLSKLPGLRRLLDLDAIEPAGSVPTPTPPPVAAVAPVPAPPALDPVRAAGHDANPRDGNAVRTLGLGRTEGVAPKDVALPADELCMHAAFLGGTGSGKTTLALSVVEQLLLEGVPVVLVDRKGDLAGYTREESWRVPLGDPAREAHRRRLREVVAPALFTPGASAGRPLGISVVPRANGDLSPDEREDEARYAAAALADALGYKAGTKDGQRRVVLARALSILARSGGDASLGRLVAFVDEKDPALVDAIGKLDPKIIDDVVQHLETFRLQNDRLVDGGGEQLDVAALLGKDGSVAPGKTRLTIISTKFLGDAMQFWVAQLLIQLGRWANRTPASKLQAAVFFDEADLYLPATSKPATKAPMENLLRRARSAGLGVLLATQSPGDFDYKCRDNIKTWMLGRITQPRALEKMKPLLADVRVDVGARLASRTAGQFYLVREGNADGFLARRPVIDPVQVPEAELLALARARHGA